MIPGIVFSTGVGTPRDHLKGRGMRGSRFSSLGFRSLAARAGAAGLALGILAFCLTATACTASGAASQSGSPRVVDVVAAENFWGSIVSQLGGSHVRVLSILTDPNADPHDYESSAADARAVATARLVVQNGVGYDDWMSKLLGAGPSSGRRILNIGAVLGKHPGDNPHLWYNPAYVTAAENRIEADLKALDPKDAAYFSARRHATDQAFAGVRAELASIKQADRGKPVASTESIFVYLAGYLGLRLISPPAFMNAVSGGNDPPAASVVEFQHQLTTGQAAALIYNKQTATALTTSIRALAAAHHVPVVGVSETIEPPAQSYERWFGSELSALAHALNGTH
jgi:zinc/manganese transport system substrate-binding protein